MVWLPRFDAGGRFAGGDRVDDGAPDDRTDVVAFIGRTAERTWRAVELPGHVGMLDQIDSLLLDRPVVRVLLGPL